ncbi:hypothetical protein WR25_12243, partial [Diploscapter pachys]
ELEQTLITATRLLERTQSSNTQNNKNYEWCLNELSKYVKAISWQIEDYEHTLSVVTASPVKFSLSPEDLLVRRLFLSSTKQFAAEIHSHYLNSTQANLAKIHQPSSIMSNNQGYRYSRLQNEDEAAGSSGAGEQNDRFEDILFKQEKIIRDQDEDLEGLGESVRTLKNMSFQIGDELEAQNVMLDDLGEGMSRVDSKLDGVMKKIARLAHLDDAQDIAIDPKGYIIYCPCMGRFGNQIDHTIGVLSFARSMDRTLVLPNFIEFKHPKTTMVPFETLFQVKPLKKLVRVVTMTEFTKYIMPKIWPQEKRVAFCWSAHKSIFNSTAADGCHAKEGNPFGPYWDTLGVEFVEDTFYGEIKGGYDLGIRGTKKEWDERYPSDTYPVLAFTSSPAPFPSTVKSWENQKFLRWNSRIVEKAKQFISSTLTRPFVGVHLRNDADWARVCEHVDPSQNRPIFASAQCLGENHHEGHLTKEMCAPSKATILEQIVDQVGKIGAKSVFVSSDKDHMLDEINEALRPYEINAYKLNPDDSYISLAILGQADHFIGNCVSTFSLVVRRERDFGSQNRKPTTYFGHKLYKRKIDL